MQCQQGEADLVKLNILHFHRLSFGGGAVLGLEEQLIIKAQLELWHP